MYTGRQTGFTLIELLLVIAIIGLLASVVISSLNDARTSGADAAIKQGLSVVRSQSNIYYNGSGFTFEGFCVDSDTVPVLQGIEDVNGGFTPECNDSVAAWAVSSPLVTTSTEWCIDSTGFTGERNAALGETEVTCPAS